MSKGPWKPESKTKNKFKRAAIKPLSEKESVIPAAVDAPPSGPQPLPIFGAPSSTDGGIPAANGPVVFDETKIKGGMGKVFISATAGIAAILNGALKNTQYTVEFEAVQPEEGDLWAEFAFPVLKMHLPNMEQNPHTVLAVMTVAILSGKIRVTKKERYDNPSPRTDTPAASSPSEIVP